MPHSATRHTIAPFDGSAGRLAISSMPANKQARPDRATRLGSYFLVKSPEINDDTMVASGQAVSSRPISTTFLCRTLWK